MGTQQPDSRVLVIYAVFLLVSLLVVSVATTALITLVLIEGAIPEADFYIFLGSMGSSLTVAILSLRAVVREYLRAGPRTVRRTTFVLQRPARYLDQNSQAAKYDPGMLSDLENGLLNILQRNNGRMLQSKIVQEMGISKVSVSRGLGSLENKGIIVRVRRGVTNEILLDETVS